MEETAKEPGQWSRIAAGIFAVGFGIVAIAGQPCSLFPISINFESSGLRWGGLAIGALAAFALAGLAYKRFDGEAAINGYAGAVGCLLLGVWFRLMPPGMNGNGFAFVLPSMLILIPLSLGVLLHVDWSMPRGWLWGFVGFAGWAALRVLPQLGRADDVLPFAAYTLVPLAAAVAYKSGLLSERYIIGVATGIWGFSCLYACQQLNWPVGISGNPNWLAATLIGVGPWVALGAARLVGRLGAGSKAVKAVAAAIPLAITAWLLLKCHTRSLYPALGITCTLAVLYRIERPARRVFFLLAVGVVIGVVAAIVAVNYYQPLRSAYNQDVRGPLWFSCARLIARRPIAGHDAGAPELLLPDLLVDSDYHDRFVAAEWMEHPHNQLIYIAMYLGIPAALVWLLLLLQAFKSPYRNPTPVRLAQFAAANMIILGFADKALIKPPSNVWWLLMLGICWAPRITVEKRRGGSAQAEPLDARPFRLAHPLVWLTCCWATVLGTLVIAWFAGNDICHSWYARRGDQLLSAGYAEQAHIYYRIALKHRPDHLPTAYKAATVALQHIQPIQREKAFESLQYVSVRNPNFAHINRLWGRYCGMIQSHERALKYFERDVELFPRNVVSRQWYLRELMANNMASRLNDAEAALNRTYVSRIRSAAEFSRDEGLPYRWLNAFEEGKWERAVQDATRMVHQIRGHEYIDPLAPWTREKGWPMGYAGSTFTPIDAAYMQSVALREKLWEEEWKKSKDPLAVVWWVFKNFEIDTKRGDWVMPHELYEARSGSVLSAVTFLCFMLREPHLIYQHKNPGAVFVLIPVDGQLAKIRFGSGFLGSKTVEFISKSERKMRIPPIHESRLAILALPPEFLTRFHILDAVRREYRSFRPYLTFARMPSLRVIETNRRFAEFGLKVSSPAGYWTHAVDGFHQRLMALKAAESKK